MNYKLSAIKPFTLDFKFEFTDGRYTYLDLSNLNDYEVVENFEGSEYWYFIVEKSWNQDYPLNIVRKFKFDDIYKYGTNIRKFKEDNVIYRKATQTEYDRYMSLTRKNSSNAKIYDILLDKYNASERIQVTLV